MASPVRYEDLICKSALNAVKAPSMPFNWSLNPYRGCQHGCSFCYARATHAFLGIRADDTFQTHILIKRNAAEQLKRELVRRAGGRGGLQSLGPVAIGTATDPYQQAEATARVTRACLEVLAEHGDGVPVSLTTRSPLILRDLDLLKRLNVVAINISMNTLDPQVWRQFEPSSPSPAKRLETLARLTAAGLPAGIILAPILPWITDGTEELRRLVREAAERGAAYVKHAVLRLSTPEVKLSFFRTLNRHYPALAPRYGAWYAHGAYPPAAYRRRIAAIVGQMLDRHQLPGQEPSRNAAAAPSPEEAAPEQLTLPL